MIPQEDNVAQQFRPVPTPTKMGKKRVRAMESITPGTPKITNLKMFFLVISNHIPYKDLLHHTS